MEGEYIRVSSCSLGVASERSNRLSDPGDGVSGLGSSAASVNLQNNGLKIMQTRY